MALEDRHIRAQVVPSLLEATDLGRQAGTGLVAGRIDLRGYLRPSPLGLRRGVLGHLGRLTPCRRQERFGLLSGVSEQLVRLLAGLGHRGVGGALGQHEGPAGFLGHGVLVHRWCRRGWRCRLDLRQACLDRLLDLGLDLGLDVGVGSRGRRRLHRRLVRCRRGGVVSGITRGLGQRLQLGLDLGGHVDRLVEEVVDLDLVVALTGDAELGLFQHPLQH